ncbi:MAG: hypothetical protein RXN86_03235 [Vulcanisaeta sp.]
MGAVALNTPFSLDWGGFLGKSTVEFISKGLILLGPKKITRMTTNPEKERYLIYLPLELNDLWREVYQNGEKVYKVYIEVPS